MTTRQKLKIERSRRKWDITMEKIKSKNREIFSTLPYKKKLELLNNGYEQ